MAPDPNGLDYFRAGESLLILRGSTTFGTSASPNLSNFTSPDQNPINMDGSWAGPCDSGGAQLKVVSNAVQSSGAGAGNSYFTRVFGANQEAGCTWHSGAGLRLYLRLTNPNSGSMQCYVAIFSTSAATPVDVYKVLSNSYTFLGSFGSTTLHDGDKVSFRAVGTTLTCYVNGSQVATTTDGAITGGGMLGLYIGSPGVSFDDFFGGDVFSTTGYRFDWFRVGESPLGLLGASPSVGGTVSMQAAPGIVFSFPANEPMLRVQEKLQAAPAIQFAPAASSLMLRVQEKLQALAGVVFGFPANEPMLRVTERLQALAAMVLAFPANLPMLRVTERLQAAVGIVFAVTAAIRDQIRFQATAAVVFAVTAALKVAERLQATAAITFAVTAFLRVQEKLQAIPAVVFGDTANLNTGFLQLQAAPAVTFADTAFIRTTVDIQATAAVTFQPTVATRVSVRLRAVPALAFGSGSAFIRVSERLQATSTTQFAIGTANLTTTSSGFVAPLEQEWLALRHVIHVT